MGTRGPVAGLHWAWNDSLRVTGEAGFQTNAFRLSRDGPLPAGTASDRTGYAELRARWRILKAILLEPRVGVTFGRRFELFDAAGDAAGTLHVRQALFYGANAMLIW